ncbi:PRP38-domain-containing protein [Moesziomyces antarcticus]|uniref:Related to PRP38A - pre-mRNA-splicing factor n=2 Tax=Pseudozyma antarctica TaxID=84753 RepID=A0A5C3FVC0_PSEA2|nr:PRP38-domain-containing protein [Moesziomyces antarcticus]GAK66474.1 PRP38-domain-containing protein [Moesziomyces antarcticus]SPO47517.1 related to PRP38A - pre-mRNA-splicing factor [Moesziomyces antarcticus]
MANATIRGAVSIHGTNPQFLVEKPVRARIYESPFWKEHCFALSAATLLPLAVDLHHVGGLTGLQRPSHFLCLLQKLLQIQPEPAIVDAYLAAKEFKYLRVLAAFYVRLTFASSDVYARLEPMLEDYSKLRWRDAGGAYSVVHMDEVVDMLLREERVCDIILPRLTRRDVCEARDGLAPRISRLETKLRSAVEGQESDASDDSDADVRRWKLERVKRAARLAHARKQHQHRGADAQEAEYTSQEEDDEAAKRRRFISPSPSVSPDRIAARQGYVSRSPSRSPDRMLPPAHSERGHISRSPSRSPDRMASTARSEEGYISRSPSRSPDRL